MSSFVTLPDIARTRGICVQGSPGVGKSRLLGRLLAFQDCYKGVPLVVIDHVGGTINNFLDKVGRCSREEQERLWPRIKYIDMASEDYIVPWPIYYRLTDTESHFTVSQRFSETVKRIDPALYNAPIMGYNAFYIISTYIGILLSAMGLQITDAVDILENPRAWTSRVTRLASHGDSDVWQASRWFLNEYIPLEKQQGKQDNYTQTFKQKVARLTLDPHTRLMFGSTGGIRWHEVDGQGQTVLIDLSRERNSELRLFKTVWVYQTFIDYIKHRGASGRKRPISLIIDELAGMVNMDRQAGEVLQRDLDDLINIYMRNYGLWLTVSFQDSFQFPENAVKTLLSMGTVITGGTTNPETARQFVRYFYQYNPYMVKAYDGHTTLFMSYDEQVVLETQRYLERRPYRFLVSLSQGEGAGARTVRMSIENMDRGQYPNNETLEEDKKILMRRTGRKREELEQLLHTQYAQVDIIQHDKQLPYEEDESLPVPTLDTIIGDDYEFENAPIQEDT